MRDGNNPEKNRSKSVQIRTKRRITPEDNCTSNNPGEEECLDNRPVNNERSQRDANATACAASRSADERRSSFTIRSPLILEARVSKTNWFEPSIKTKVDLFQNFLECSSNGSRSPYFNEEKSQPGLTSSVASRKKDIKTIHGDSGEKQNDSSIKTVVTSQGSKRKITNGNNVSAPTSKRLLCSAKKNSTKGNQTKWHKPQIKSLLLNRSRSATKIIVKKENSTKSKLSLKTSYPSDDILSTSKSYSTPKITISNVPIHKDAICTCSNHAKFQQRSQSKRSSSTKSARKSKKRKRSSKSSTKRRRQSRTSAAKRRKSKKNYAKSRKSNRTSKSRAQSKQRRSTKNRVGPRNSRIERTGVKSKRNEARGERIATKRESKAKRLQSKKKIEPFKVKLKETLKEKKAIKKATLATKRRSVSRKEKRRSKNRKNTNAVRDAEVYSGKVSDTNHPSDVAKPVDKIESLREQGDAYNTPKERIKTTNADVEIQCCLLTSSQCLPNTCAQSMINESINSNNFVNESTPFGAHLVSTQESKIRNLDQEALDETEQRVVNMNGKIGVNNPSQSVTLNPDLSLLSSGGTFSMMKEQTENPTSSFSQSEGRDGNLSEQNGKMSNLDGQATTRKKIESLMNVGDQIFVCNQSLPLTSTWDLEMESRNADVMGEQIKNPSNSFNDSRELNERLSNPSEEISRNFDLKSFMQNETKENVLNIDDHIDRNNQSYSLSSAQDFQFDPGIDSESMETRGNPNYYFGKSNEQFLNPPVKSNRNLDEQMDVRDMTKECLMTTDEPVEAQQHDFQPFTIQNLPIQSGVTIDMVEENENTSKLTGQWNEFTTRELRNKINSDEQSDANNKTEQSLLSTDDQTETGSQSDLTESFQSLSCIPFGGAKQMTSKGKKGSVSSLNEPKRLAEQLSDLRDDGSIYLDGQVSTNNEQCSTNVYNQAEDNQPHFKTSAQNLTLADVVAKVMNGNIRPRSSSKKLNGHIEQLSKSTENINRNSNQQANNEFQKSPLSFKLHKTLHNESMALLPYEPSRFVSPLRENATSGFLSNESDGFNEQFSNSPVETTSINEVGVSLLELVSLSLSQGVSPENITYSSDQIQEVESQIRTFRCIYIQESNSIPEDEQESEVSSAEDDSVPVNYIRPSTSLILQGLPNWLRYLYNNLFRSKK